MFNVNRVTLLGNVTRDPEGRATKSGTTVATIGFATNHRTKDADGKIVNEPDYHRLVCFGALADFTVQSVAKGSPLYVEGRLHTSKYKNKKGEDASKTEVIVDRLVLLSTSKGVVQAAQGEVTV